MGDVFSVRIAGNVVSDRVLGSLEYACQIAGSKLIVVLGHTQCGAVTAAANLHRDAIDAAAGYGCQYLDGIVREIQMSIDETIAARLAASSGDEREEILSEVSRRNVLRVMSAVRISSSVLGQLERQGDIGLVGGVYDVADGRIDWLDE